MATTVARLEAILTANTAQFERAMTTSESRMQKTRRVAGIAGAAIAGGLAYGLEKSVKAAMDAQVSETRLEQAFKTSGLAAGRYTKQVTALETAGRKLGFADEQTKESLGSLLVATHSMTKASHDLSVAQDVARFKHVDLTQATKMLTMAMAGSQRAAKQLGISVPNVTSAEDALAKNATKAEQAHAKFIDKQRTGEAVIEAVRQKLGGQADAYSKTAAGGMEQFRAQLNHLEVTMGTALLPALAQVAGALARGTEFFSKHATTAKVLAGALGVLAAALLAAKIQQLAMNLAVLANPYVAAGVAVVAFGVLIYKFRDKLMNVYEWIRTHWVLLSGLLAGPIGLAVAEIIKHRDRIVTIFTNLPGQLWSAFKTAWASVVNMGEFIYNHTVQPIINVFNNAWDGAKGVKDAVSGLFGKIVGWIKGFLGINSPSTVFHGIGQNMIQGLMNGIGSMGGALKHYVIKVAKDAVGNLWHGAGDILHGGGATGSQANRNLGQKMAARYGWGTGEQWLNLDALFNRESGWSNTAKNPTSGAYGIPQALPESKLPFAGREAGGSHAGPQIAWGLNYIAGRYGSPVAAMAHEQQFGWYDKGGWLPTGMSLAVNNTGRPERVVPPGGDNVVIPISIGGEHVATVLFDFLRRKAKVYENRNGRLAFGGM